MAVAAFFKRLFFGEAFLLAQTGKGVIFAEKGNDWRAAAKGGGKGGGQTGDAGFDIKAFLLQKRTKQFAGARFLEFCFGIAPNFIAGMGPTLLFFIN